MDDKQDKKAKIPREVVFFAYPKFIMAWPLIVLGPLLWLLGMVWVPDETLAWIYILTLVVVILAMGVDIERNHAIFWIVAILLFIFVGMWLGEKDIPLFPDLYGFFEGLDLTYDRKLGMVMSGLLAVPFAVMMVWTRLNHKWRITHNEFELHSFGRRDLSLARGAKTVRSSYPDWFELLLCMSGTLVVYDARGAKVLQRIENVPLLPLVRKRIDKILESTAVTTDAMMEEVEGEEEDASSELEHGGEDGGEAVGDQEKL